VYITTFPTKTLHLNIGQLAYLTVLAIGAGRGAFKPGGMAI